MYHDIHSLFYVVFEEIWVNTLQSGILVVVQGSFEF